MAAWVVVRAAVMAAGWGAGKAVGWMAAETAAGWVVVKLLAARAGWEAGSGAAAVDPAPVHAWAHEMFLHNGICVL